MNSNDSMPPNDALLAFPPRYLEGQDSRPAKKIRNDPNDASTNELCDVFDPDVVDSVIAKELAQLSTEDRERVYFDIHGVAGSDNETPELIQTKMKELNAHMMGLPDADAYRAALMIDEAYVRDEASLLRFLRCDRFDVQKAAVRLASFYQYKQELFGVEKLTHDIVQDDLDEETMEVVYSGNLQLLRLKDQSGRAVGVQFLQAAEHSVTSKLRAIFYFSLKATEDETVQRLGHISVLFLVGQRLDFLNTFVKRRQHVVAIARMVDAIPLRQVGLHVCHDSLTWRVLVAVFKMTAHAYYRVRFREHFGDLPECLQQLRSFGIPVDCFPVDEDGALKTDYNNQRNENMREMERRKRRGDAIASMKGHDFAIVLVPYKCDVLLGRGKACYSHPGNVQLRIIVQQREDEYERADLPGKKRISSEIVLEIRETMGYFLTADHSGYWIEVSTEVAKKKVSHCFRTLRRNQGQTDNNMGEMEVMDPE